MTSSDTTLMLGEQILDDPALLTTLADTTTPATVYEAVDAAWQAYLTEPTQDRWTAFSNVLVVADTTGMSGEHLLAFGRKWAEQEHTATTLPSVEVVNMFGPHLLAAGRLMSFEPEPTPGTLAD